jgi:hypothetical protein
MIDKTTLFIISIVVIVAGVFGYMKFKIDSMERELGRLEDNITQQVEVQKKAVFEAVQDIKIMEVNDEINETLNNPHPILDGVYGL